MLKRLLLLASLMPAISAWAQTDSPAVELANLREDVDGLSQRLGDLTLRVEQLEAENGRLRAEIKSIGQNAATVKQLNEAITDLNRAIQTAIDAAKEETPAPEASAGKKTSAPTNFGTDFPKEGVNYTVQRGDTLALIAKKTGARISDIINANRIADPSRIQAGQALFIPGGK